MCLSSPKPMQMSLSMVIVQTALCRFHGMAIDNVELSLTPTAMVYLNNMNREDQRMWYSLMGYQLLLPSNTHNLSELRQYQAIVLAFYIIGGHIGLPILFILSILKGRRDPIFLNFCFTWVISSVISSIGWVKLHNSIVMAYSLHFARLRQTVSWWTFKRINFTFS